MATSKESQAESHALVLVHDRKRKGAPRHTSIFRLALPLIYAGMGVALGSVAGIGMAFMTVPAGATVAANDVTPAISKASAPETSQAAISAPIQAVRPAAMVRVAAQSSEANTDQRNARADQSGIGATASKVGLKYEQAPSTQATPGKTPDAEESPEAPFEPAVAHPRKHVAHPLMVPVRKVLASDAEVEPVVLDADELSVDDGSKSSAFYSEGDLTVADYDAAGGTIETSDGRVFVVGQTVSVSNATSWEDYRASVHYRCDGDGSCTLMRHGVIAPNAKLVQTI
jgi:hypothetical protein